jgi:7-cyano-7-deazaguanine synthase
MGPLAYVLLSGGIDSSTCVSEAIKTVGQRNVRCVSIDYGQRHKRELEFAKKVAAYYARPHEILPVSIPRSMLTDPSIDVPNISYSQITGVSPTYVPFRNGLMLSTLASHIAGRHFDPTRAYLGNPPALRTNEETGEQEKMPNPEYDRDVLLYFGAHAEDAAGWAYPDCTPEFIGAMANALYVGTYHKLRLITPWAYMMKDQIVKRGTELGTPYHLTWSCYKGGEEHCGTCSTCRSRRGAFVLAGVEDPTHYAADPEPVAA